MHCSHFKGNINTKNFRFQKFFDRHPEVLLHFDKFKAIEIDGVRVETGINVFFVTDGWRMAPRRSG